MSTEVTTAQMNRVICEFMGWEFRPDSDDWFKAYHDGQLMWADDGKFINRIMLEGFNYHEDWNELMPVVEKIEDLPTVVRMENEPNQMDKNYSVTVWIDPEDEPIIQVCDCSKIKAVYKAVYQFITWFNQQKQNDAGNMV